MYFREIALALLTLLFTTFSTPLNLTLTTLLGTSEARKQDSELRKTNTQKLDNRKIQDLEEAFEVRYQPSGSMEPTLHGSGETDKADWILVDKLAYRSQSPKRGDIIVFEPTKNLRQEQYTEPFLKRIIGLPGETIELSKDGKVLINNKPLQENYIEKGQATVIDVCSSEPNQAFLSKPQTIPENQYLMLGDNRGSSYDSRCWGVVPRKNIIGQVVRVVWPTTEERKFDETRTTQQRADEELFLKYIGFVMIPSNLNDYPKYIDYFQKRLAAFQKDEDIPGQIVSLKNLIVLYFQLGDFTKILNYSLRLLALAQESNNQNAEMYALFGLSTISSELGKIKLKQLYQVLIEPIASFLPSDPNEHVIFIPDQSLFLVPFAALIDSQEKYLIEKHTILTAPSIQVLDLTRKQRQKISGNGVLVVGNPKMPSVSTRIAEKPQPLPTLPGAEKEARAIAQFFNTQAITGADATKVAILQKMPKARIIHLATHGLLDDFTGSGLPGAIALAPFANDNGLLTSDEIFNLKLNAELVVLSACDTGQGRITGDGVVGLSRSLISAGVPSVITTLWTIPDESSAFLMTEFYRQFKQNPDKAQALRTAMLATMKQHPNPIDWAAFTLVGESK